MSQSLMIDKGDVAISGASGRPVLITDAKKLRQDISEFFSIEVLPSGFGAGIEQLIGVVEVSSEVFISLVDRHIRDGFDTFKSLQNSDPRIPRPTDERILAITYLAVEKDPEDPTRYFFRTNIVTEKGIELPFTNVLTV